MSSILTARQTSELHKAIVQYLGPLLENHPGTLETIGEALAVDGDTPVPHYLEKKWSTVLRLQKKILDLENEVASYKALVASASGGASGALVPSREKSRWLPTAPAKVLPTPSAQMVNAVALHPKLPLLVGACSDGTMMAWNLAADDAETPQRSWTGHTRAVHRLRWSPAAVGLAPGDSAYLLASCSSDLSIKIWAGDALRHVRTLTGHGHTVSGVCFSPVDGSILYSVSRDKTVKIWDLASGHCIKTFVGHSDWVRDLDVASVNAALSLSAAKNSDLGDFVLTCSNDHSVRLSHSSGTGLCMLLGHGHVVETARFLPMYSAQYVDAYLLQNMDKFPYLSDAIVQNPIYKDLGFKYCVSAGRDNVIKLWLLAPPVLSPHRPPTPSVQNNSQGWHILDLLGHQSWVRTLELHPGGKYIISGSDDKTIRVWDLAALAEKGAVVCCKTINGHEGFVNAVHFAPFELHAENVAEPDEATAAVEKSMRCLFASAGTDNTVRVWS